MGIILEIIGGLMVLCGIAWTVFVIGAGGSGVQGAYSGPTIIALAIAAAPGLGTCVVGFLLVAAGNALGYLRDIARHTRRTATALERQSREP